MNCIRHMHYWIATDSYMRYSSKYHTIKKNQVSNIRLNLDNGKIEEASFSQTHTHRIEPSSCSEHNMRPAAQPSAAQNTHTEKI